MTPVELAARWRQDAEVCARYGDERGAGVLHRVADELDAALRATGDEALTLEAAAMESGYSRDRLRHMVADGEIPNAGRRGAPRIRRGDLPRKKSSRGDAFDPAAAARSVLHGTSIMP